MANRISPQQRWQLALSLASIYSVIVLYVTVPERIHHFINFHFYFGFALPYWLINVVLFFIWLGVADWIQQQLFQRYGENYLLEFRLPAQLTSLVASLALALLYNMALQGGLHMYFSIRHFIFPPEHILPPKDRPSQQVEALFDRFNNSFSVIVMLFTFYLTASIRAYQHIKEIQVRSERLEKENVQAQFAALKNQVNPHFLFNSLSILSSVVHIDAELSEKFIAQLSKSYRYILEQKDNDLVSLKTELDFIQSYTFLLKIRFREKFDVEIQVPEQVQEQYRIAPLTLQLLVENAVKHTSMSTKTPLRVRIRVEGNTLIVENGLSPRLQPEVSTGVGLKNITARYNILTSRPVWYGEQDGMFVVKIPLIV
ncbi:MAG: histidine kinase [Siphonobacter sp.]